ncbi:MAG: hypothetical protein ACK6AO_18985, partial [Planctomycetota bacterium]
MTKHDVWDSLMGLNVQLSTFFKLQLIRLSVSALVAIITLESFALAQNQGNAVDNGLGLAGRKLADGVLTIIPSDQNAEDTALGPF